MNIKVKKAKYMVMIDSRDLGGFVLVKKDTKEY